MQGHIEGTAMLGRCYMYGDGVAQDEKEAIALLRRAAEKNNPLAQWHLHEAYALGFGVPKDFVQAYLWCGLAAKAPYYWAARIAKKSIAEDMTPVQLNEAEKLLNEWKPKS